MRALVVGAEGFIGRHIVQSLRAHGWDVVSTVYARRPGTGELHVDAAQDDLARVLPSTCDLLVNAAGGVRMSASAAEMERVNLTLVERLASWARGRTSHFVQLSSVAVYGPWTVGPMRDEATRALGARIGMPYMTTKARAELALARASVPYSLLRAPIVIGAHDTVLSPSVVAGLRGDGVALPGPRALQRRATLASADGIGTLVARLAARGPLGGPLHVGHLEPTLGELLAAYAEALQTPVRLRRPRLRELLERRHDAGFQWLLASGSLGQRYATKTLAATLGLHDLPSLRETVREACSVV
jgi:nucleoside-diphosphate-sugar epimerase